MFKRAFVVLMVFLLVIPFAWSLTKIEVNEGDLIKLKLQATDADGDLLTYEFTSPLNGDGEWQTNFNDAGEYMSSVIVTDSKGSQTAEDIKLIVNNVNRPPEIPQFGQIEVQETESIDLNLPKTDIDGDKLSYKISPPLDSEGRWQTGFNDAGVYDVSLTASDGELIDKQEITITVHDKDRKAEFSNIERNITEGKSIQISFPEEDPDGDIITYSGELIYNSRIEGNKFIWSPDFDVVQPNSNWLKKNLFIIGLGNTNKDASRTFTIPITATTDKSADKFTLTLTVLNKNRPPVIEGVHDFTVFETESFDIKPVVYDPDNDPVRISFSGSLDTYKYKTDYDDAGEYKIKITATDGDLAAEKEINVVVLNMNRLPSLTADRVMIREGEKSIIPIKAVDPDNEEVLIEKKRLPETARYEDNNTIVFRPTYDFVEHTDENTRNFVDRIMNKYFGFKQYRKETFATLELYDGIDSVETDLIIDVKDVNQKPVVEPVEKQTVKEGQLLYVPLKGYDPDGDDLRYKFKGIVKQNNQTVGFDKAGLHNLTIIVSDGKASESLVVPIEVIDVNRPPVFNLASISVKEGETITIPLKAKDPDKNNITYSIVKAPTGAKLINGSVLEYTPIYEAVSHYIKNENGTMIRNPVDYNEFLFSIKASDPEFDVVMDTIIKVIDVNRQPEIVTFSPAEKFKAKRGSKIEFFISANDPDGDELKYLWKPSALQKIEDDNRHVRKLLKTGLRDFSVIVSDGQASVEHQWQFIVR